MYLDLVGVGLTVRVATEDDAESAVDVIRRSISELCTADHRDDPEALADWLANKTVPNFRRWQASPGQYTVVAEVDGTLCGVGMLSADGEVRLCYVHPRFTRRGAGGGLIRAMETHADGLGLTRLHLDATVSAMRFYEAMGFRESSPSTAVSDGSESHPYEKQIGARNRHP